MAEQDISVKNIVIKYVLPVIAILFLLRFLSKNMKGFRKQFIAWLSNKMLKRMHKRMQKEKDTVFEDLRNIARKSSRNLQILEIGSGSGCNFKNFPKGAEIVCLDPNPYNKKYIESNLQEMNPDVSLKQFVVGFAESMPEIEDGCCDAVVCTLVLCTVRDVDAVLAEVKRVLKPNGVFFFVEHVAAETGTFKRKFQNFINPLWKIMCEGCNINRETWKLVRSAGFKSVDLTHFNFKMMKMITPCIYGQATK